MPPFGKSPDTIVHQDEPLNAEPPRAGLAGAPITPLERFYVRNHGPVPGDAGPLRLDGLVQRPVELTLADLRALPRRELTVTLQCAGNRRAELLRVRDIPGEAPWGPGATGTAHWAGAALADVLATAGVDPAARHVGLTGADRSEEADPPQRYEISIPTPGAGIPLGEVALNSDILSATVTPGAVELQGYAFAGGERRVARVEISAGGHWTAAELLDDQGPWAWRLWRAALPLPAGRHELLVRAWDSAGATQPEHPATVWNPKGYGNSAWGRIEVEVP
jgi:sulfite oxidase